ncbi:YchJ family protein [Nocardioides jiangxiensis]|uniref:YchJ family metal-binding protein n=1 Tax=Nocardioides jiangxiensis TaxID=3064524 RepID=A0ABT9B1V8_9ACTN|nr:YchJ family metal-binding protein [Nocardioides sp. WY-20]MDO7868824.1 YchJ family metal-binding protein [Nocardioides sp. WY-20]
MEFTGYPRLCPCGTGSNYGVCCGRLISGAAQARTAEELMRSRYSAYALGELDHVFRTWHPRTRPDDVSPAPGVEFIGLTILDIVAGGPDDDLGVVEFIARMRTPEGADEMHERSRFSRRAGRWMYVDGNVPDVAAADDTPAPRTIELPVQRSTRHGQG